jgi:unsaturated chondroitin disaccharide hydrolase
MRALKIFASLIVVLSLLLSVVSCQFPNFANSGEGGDRDTGDVGSGSGDSAGVGSGDTAGGASDEGLTEAKLAAAMDVALEKLDYLIARYPYHFPSGSSKDGKYGTDQNVSGWVTGFFMGMLFLAYEYTEDVEYLQVAMDHMDSFINRVDNNVGMNDHDIGFNFMLSTVYAYRATGDTLYRDKAVAAARVLANRFCEEGQYIHVMGTVGAANPNPRHFSLIIDTLMNLPLLYWASEETEDPEFARRAIGHFNTTMSTVIRESGATYQDYYFDPVTGEPTHGDTRQGSKDYMDLGGSWSRGHSWGILGMPISYSYNPDNSIIDKYYKIVDFYISRLPEDNVPYWDLYFTDGDEPRDSSAAAISVCGLVEATRNMPLSSEKKAEYTEVYEKIMLSLIDNYATEVGDGNDGLLAHGTHYYAGNTGVDECCIFGDYFYMEALMRLLRPEHERYW